MDGTVYATTAWDPDGPGPKTPKLVAAGTITRAGAATVKNIAVYDPDTRLWSALGKGLTSTNSSTAAVYAVIGMPNGDLIAGGSFTTAGTVAASNIARWDGSAWSPVGAGANSTVRALALMTNGDLAAGGDFTGFGSVTTNRTARWNGAAWAALGSGMNSTVRALGVRANGDLVAGGDFTTAGGASIARVARWNGNAWVALGTGISGTVYAVAAMPNGDVVAGGFFDTAGGVSAASIARWDGVAWSALGAGSSYKVYSLAALPNGDLLAGGSFATAGGVSCLNVARWNGSSWASMGPGLSPYVWSLTAMPSGDIVAGGEANTFSSGGAPVGTIGAWNGSSWSMLGLGVSSYVNFMIALPDGDVLAGGSFYSAGGLTTNRIARWNGSTWAGLGTGVTVPTGTGSFPQVFALTPMPNGDIVAGGTFAYAGGTPASNIARWNGTSWSPLGAGTDDLVLALTVLPSGDLMAGGTFVTAGGVVVDDVARWNGLAWSRVRPSWSFTPLTVRSLVTLASGDVIQGGDGQQGSDIVRLTGTTYTSLGMGLSGTSVRAVTVLPNGDLVVGGAFSFAGTVSARNIARWNGSTWSALGSGTNNTVRALATMPNGDVIAGGDFTTAGGVSASTIARWDGTTWSPLGVGTANPAPFTPYVRALVALPNGELIVGGSFSAAGGNVSPNFARYSTSGAPTVSLQPTMQAITPGQTLSLSATPSNGYSGVSFQWLRNGVAIANGVGGASVGGGFVSGASGALASPTRVSIATLVISNAQVSDAGQYSAVFSNTCGSVSTAEVSAMVVAPCRVDYNLDGSLNPDDIGDFISDYFTQPPVAGPGGYASVCPGNVAPYDAGYKAGYTSDGSGQCGEPNPDNLGDWITDYFIGCPA